MTKARKFTIWGVVVGVVVGVAAMLIVLHKRQRVTLQGAVITQDSDPQKQLPIANVEITATTASTVNSTRSDPSGFFRITLPKGFRRRQSATLRFRHPGYRPLDLDVIVTGSLYIARMPAIAHEVQPEPDHPSVVISNVRLRYSLAATSEAAIGSVARTFHVVNIGNVPCKGRPPCSPDGKWKAAEGSLSIDAGEGYVFRNARVSCIAGPCPFTSIELNGVAPGQRLRATARDWSDTATFLLEAEVAHPMQTNLVRDSYPVIFGRTLSFSIPATAEGPSLNAELNGESIVFPLGPNPSLSWAQCSAGTNKDQTRLYRCELNSGYRFQ